MALQCEMVQQIVLHGSPPCEQREVALAIQVPQRNNVSHMAGPQDILGINAFGRI